MRTEEQLLNQLLEAERAVPLRQAKEIEAAWPTFINTCAALLDLGPGPSATITKETFGEKLIKMANLYEEVYSAAAAGRPEFPVTEI